MIINKEGMDEGIENGKMEELMNYKEKYEKALERAKVINPGTADYEVAVKIFPELKESDDERIRKNIIEYLEQSQFGEEHYMIDDDIVRGYIAWLEKQGKNNTDKIIERARTEKQRVLLTETNGDAHIDWDCRDLQDVKLLLKYGLEYIDSQFKKQGEQKQDAVVPKFKVGDWVVYCNEDVDIITGIDDNGYLINESGYISFTSQGDIRLWTIQDAKEGDVLVAKIGEEPNNFIYVFGEYDQNLGFWSHCYLDACINKFHEGIYHNNLNVGVPATKEQRDLLFQKMKEAGYEWSDKDRKLIKIEQKSTWSEEDKKKIDRLIGILKVNHPNGRFKVNPINTPHIKSITTEEIVDWLKSLKERYTWKPSEGQLECLGYAIEKAEKDWSPLTNNRIYLTLKALKEQLKKLREE